MFESDDVEIAAKVEFLRRADSYPIGTATVEVVETHLSWVFLTDSRVYKLKKPVRRANLDLSTLGARRRNCELELRLNRRLAPDVYLGLVPLVCTAQGRLTLEEPGSVVDWLVEMRRLDRRHLLDAAIRAGTVDRAQLDAVAQLLVDFYRHAFRVPMTAGAYRERCLADIADSAHVLAAPRVGLDAEQLADVVAALVCYARTHDAHFVARIAAHRLVEGHGDLRPEHVSLMPQPLVIDCLEFDRDLRTVDVADELAYLGLECEHLGAAWVGDRVLATYGVLSGDTPPAPLVAFYKCARALLRAKLCVGHLDDLAPPAHGRWIERAKAYFALARKYAATLRTN